MSPALSARMDDKLDEYQIFILAVSIFAIGLQDAKGEDLPLQVNA